MSLFKRVYYNDRRPPSGIYIPYNGTTAYPSLGTFVIEEGAKGTYRFTSDGHGNPHVELINGANGFGRVAVSAFNPINDPSWRRVL